MRGQARVAGMAAAAAVTGSDGELSREWMEIAQKE